MIASTALRPRSRHREGAGRAVRPAAGPGCWFRHRSWRSPSLTAIAAQRNSRAFVTASYGGKADTHVPARHAILSTPEFILGFLPVALVGFHWPAASVDHVGRCAGWWSPACSSTAGGTARSSCCCSGLHLINYDRPARYRLTGGSIRAAHHWLVGGVALTWRCSAGSNARTPIRSAAAVAGLHT